MNPNQQYPYHFTQHTPGPPQPPWQAPPHRQGWGDPRPQGHQPQPSGPQSPVSPFQSTPFGYHPPPPPPGGPYTPQQGQPSQYNTSTWGVKYNQNPQVHQQQEQRPPLPPRPTSAASHTSPQPEQATPANQWQQSFGGTSSAQSQQQNQWPDPYYAHGQHPSQSHDAPPPPPPPRPPEYQTQLQTQYQQPQPPHEHYSHQPATHHYEPGSQNTQNIPQQPPTHFYHSSVASIPAQPAVDNAPVSPIESAPQGWQSRPSAGRHEASNTLAPTSEVDVSQFYSSALGTGGPSDWEHFGGPSSNIFPDPTSPPPRMEATASPGFDTPLQTKPRPTTESRPQAAGNAMFESPAPVNTTPAAVQNNERPSLGQQRDSESLPMLNDGTKRTGTIDSVIEAWNTPLKVPSKAGAQTGLHPSSQAPAPTQLEPPAQERIVEVEKVVEKVVDPYDDLEPEVKASLKRYVAMLRKESAAQTDEEKFSTFENFIAKELRLRSMMYGVEAKLQMVKEVVTPAPAAKAANDGKVQTSIGATTVDQHSHNLGDNRRPEVQSKPESPAAAVSQPAREVPQLHSEAEQQMKVTEPERIAAQAARAPAQSAPVPDPPRSITPTPIQTTTKDATTNQSKDEPFVLVNAGDDEPEYSPGGRPRVKKPTPIVTARTTPASPPKPQRSQMSPSANAPMVLEDYVMPGRPPSPGSNAPMILEPNSATDLPQVVTPNSGAFNRNGNGQSGESRPNSTPSIKFEPARPAYTPFRYNSTVEGPKLPADQSYSSLRKDAVDSGRLLVHEVSLPAGVDVTPERSSTPSRKTHDEAFIGLIRQQSKAIRKKTPDAVAVGPIPQLRPGTPARTPTPSQQPPLQAKGSDLLTKTAALRHLLPASVPDSYGLSQHAKANSVKAAIDLIPDSFGFIHETVVAWDLKNREVRKKQDDERSARQADSEQHIDDLFNDNEIGYADIGGLEAGFKLAEAERKYQEDQQELESFTQGVYLPITKHLQKELADLNTQYAVAIDLLDLECEPASRMLKSQGSKAEMAFVMYCVLSVFNKLEIRHQKIAEANVERERRRKRLELTVLYTNGDTTGVKSLEAEFAVAEKMQVLHEARGKDTRSNKLMDTFDRATVRGLGDNQTYVDDLLVRIRELKEFVLKDPNTLPENVYDAGGPRDCLALAQKAIDFVLADSQKLLTISNVADKILNDADYAVSVAEARVSNADAPTYDKLASEKEKEDQKIVEDTNSRMVSIAKGPEEASGLIREVVDRVGDDPLHKERMKAALEAAKRRNAEKESAD